MINVICVHTAMALVEPLTKTFAELLPEVNVNHIADSSLIKEVIANNQVTPAVRRRLLAYYNAAADAGADVVFNTCGTGFDGTNGTALVRTDRQARVVKSCFRCKGLAQIPWSITIGTIETIDTISL